jgi:hypothetical protein
MTANVLEEGDTLALDFNKLAKVAEGLMARLGAYCLSVLHKEHMTKRNILLNISSKQPISPRSGHQPPNFVIYS